MSARHTRFNSMGLAEARRIGLRPQVYRHERWARALNILMRWAEEPCREKDYWRRIEMCRRIHRLIMKAEAMRAWRESKWKYDKELMKFSVIGHIRGWSRNDRLVVPYPIAKSGRPSGSPNTKRGW